MDKNDKIIIKIKKIYLQNKTKTVNNVKYDQELYLLSLQFLYVYNFRLLKRSKFYLLQKCSGYTLRKKQVQRPLTEKHHPTNVGSSRYNIYPKLSPSHWLYPTFRQSHWLIRIAGCLHLWDDTSLLKVSKVYRRYLYIN